MDSAHALASAPETLDGFAVLVQNLGVAIDAQSTLSESKTNALNRRASRHDTFPYHRVVHNGRDLRHIKGVVHAPGSITEKELAIRVLLGLAFTRVLLKSGLQTDEKRTQKKTECRT